MLIKTLKKNKENYLIFEVNTTYQAMVMTRGWCLMALFYPQHGRYELSHAWGASPCRSSA